MHSSSITLPVSSLQRAVFTNLLKNLCSYGNHFSWGVPLNSSVRLFGILLCLSESYSELLVISLLKTLQCLPSSLRFPRPSVNSQPWPILSWYPHPISDLATPSPSVPLASLLYFNHVNHLPPSGLCTFCSLGLKNSCPQISAGFTPSLPSDLLLRKAFPDNLI